VAEAGVVLLVEGLSDQAALETLAHRRGRDLVSDRVRIVPIGGAQAVARFASELGRPGLGLRLRGLCDAGEEQHFRRALGDGAVFVCVADLEDELIRALGPRVVEEVLDVHGDLASFRTFQKQPAQQERTHHQQLHRWMGNRKIRYARLLVDALDLTQVPRPLERVLAHV
jgi:hypothetical protein